MNLGPNFNNRKLFTGDRSRDEVRNSRMKLKEQVSKKKYGYQNAMRETNTDKGEVSNAEKRFNHLEAMRNIKRGF